MSFPLASPPASVDPRGPYVTSEKRFREPARPYAYRIRAVCRDADTPAEKKTNSNNNDAKRAFIRTFFFFLFFFPRVHIIIVITHTHTHTCAPVFFQHSRHKPPPTRTDGRVFRTPTLLSHCVHTVRATWQFDGRANTACQSFYIRLCFVDNWLYPATGCRRHYLNRRFVLRTTSRRFPPRPPPHRTRTHICWRRASIYKSNIIRVRLPLLLSDDRCILLLLLLLLPVAVSRFNYLLPSVRPRAVFAVRD